MTFADLSVLCRIDRLSPLLFLCRAKNEPLEISSDDLHQLYWLNAGHVADTADNEMVWSFRRFFEREHTDLRRFVPLNPAASEYVASLSLIERAIDLGWVVPRATEWGIAELHVRRLFALPESAIFGFNRWEGTLESFLEQPWAGKPDPMGMGATPVDALGDDAAFAIQIPGWALNGLREELQSSARQRTGEEWYIHALERKDEYPLRALRQDLRQSALVLQP